MEIKKETGVAILKETGSPIGVVILQVVSGRPGMYLVRTKSGETNLPKEKLLPICQGISQETNFDTSVIVGKLPEIIRNFAILFRDQQKQIDDFKKQTRSFENKLEALTDIIAKQIRN